MILFDKITSLKICLIVNSNISLKINFLTFSKEISKVEILKEFTITNNAIIDAIIILLKIFLI